MSWTLQSTAQTEHGQTKLRLRSRTLLATVLPSTGSHCGGGRPEPLPGELAEWDSLRRL